MYRGDLEKGVGNPMIVGSALEEGFSRDLEKNYLSIKLQSVSKWRLTAQAPATEATIPPEIIMGRTPLVLLKSIPLSAPAKTLFAESCFPRICPIKELIPL
jgi:hypothetical protein